MKAKSEKRRPFIGDQIDECRDASGLFYILAFHKVSVIQCIFRYLARYDYVFTPISRLLFQGYITNWEAQKTIWDYVFSDQCAKVNFKDAPIVVTEPYFNFPSIQDAMTEIFFEEYDCQALLRINRESTNLISVSEPSKLFEFVITGVEFLAGDLSAYNYSKSHPKALCCLVVDSGYSFTHIIPYIKGEKYRKGIIRIDVGGKLLTNHLKEVISYR